MADYNFLNLSSIEFEDLVRDILQKELNISLESFTEGKDNGIDLRYTVVDNIIIQCKRYKDYSSLESVLKSEMLKLKKLKLDRYILVTSVGLTPNNKQYISELFKPYIKKEADIIGRNDLNNLLGKFPDIERNHFKLWLSSSVVLERILHSKIYNETIFEKEKIEKSISVYAYNESFLQAQNLLSKNRSIIISGIPGIGKTTLARILSFQYMAEGYEEFICISDSVDAGFKLYKENTKQIFLFDDFLGRNFLENKLTLNEDQKLITFIEKISFSKNKIFILTTREYILAQAKQRYELLNRDAFILSKYVLDLDKYSRFVKAKILYNHLFFSHLPQCYINNLLIDKNYLKIIDHRNYNPRIIESVVYMKTWESIPVDKFAQTFISFLNYPDKVWQHVFENQISILSQCILANLLTTGTPILLPDLRNIVQHFIGIHQEKYQIAYTELAFNKALKEIENTYIKISKDRKNNFAVDFLNPSVQDFLSGYFSKMEDYIADLITTFKYLNQFTHIFTFKPCGHNQIQLTANNKKILMDKVVMDFDVLTSSLIYPYADFFSNTVQFEKRDFSELKKILVLIGSDLFEDSEILEFVIEKAKQYFLLEDLSVVDIDEYISLCVGLYEYYEVKPELLSKIAEQLDDYTDIETFIDIKNIAPVEYESFIKGKGGEIVREKAYRLYDDLFCPSENELESYIEELEFLSENIYLNADDLIDKFNEDLKEMQEDRITKDNDNEGKYYERTRKKEETNYEIENMFNSLSSRDNMEAIT